MRTRVVIVGAVLAAVLAAAMALRDTGRPAASRAVAAGPVPDSAGSQAPVPVSTATAAAGDVVARVLATGTITSIRDANLGSTLSGRVAAVLVDEGAIVAAGTPLVQLDTSDLLAQQAQAQAAVAAARAQWQKVVAGARPQERQQSTDAVEQAGAALASARASGRWAQVTVDRDRSLLAQGAISQQDLDQAMTQLGVARAQVAQAQAAYDSAVQNAALVHIGARTEDIEAAHAQLNQVQATLAAIQVQLRDATIRAPFAGKITKRNVEPGQIVSPATSSTTPLLVLSQVDDVYAEFVVPAQHRFELAPGQPAVMTVDGLPGRTFRGLVQEVRPAADPASRTFGVRIRLANPDGALHPGMFARGGIITGVRHGVLQMPEGAVVTAASGPMVFVVRGGRAVRREVTLGARHDGMVEVAGGLSAGETVVVQGQDALTDNQPVVVRGR